MQITQEARGDRSLQVGAVVVMVVGAEENACGAAIQLQCWQHLHSCSKVIR